MPKYALTPVEYDEISFVHAGANPDADIVLAKADTSKMCPDSGDMHVDGPMKMAGKKKKLTKTEALKAVADKGGSTDAGVYKTQANVYSSVLDLGSDILTVITNGGTRTDIAKLLQDHADLVSHDVDNWLDPKVSKSTDYDPEIIETLRDSQEVINTVLAKAGHRSDVMPITDEERAGLPDTVRKYLENLESVTKDSDEEKEEEVDDETVEEIDDIEVDVEFEDEEEDEKVLASVGKKVNRPKVKRMKLVSGNKKTSGNRSSSGSKKFTGGAGFAGFGKSAEEADEILKGITDPSTQEIVKDLLGTQKALLAEIEKGQEEKEVARWVETAKAWTHLPGKPEDIGAQLRAVEKSLGEEAAKNLAAQMEAAQTMAKQSNVFKSAGVGGGEGSDAKNKIEKAVEAEIEKFKAEGVSAEVAKAKAQVSVFEAHPEYYDEYVATKGVK